MWNKIKTKPLLKNLILALLTAIVILVLTLLWMRIYTNHGEKIETPNFMGLSIVESQKLADENGLRLSIDSVYSSKPKNTVIIQNPLPFSDSLESWVKSNRIIYLTLVRKLEQKIKLPDVKDNSKSLAVTKLTISGLIPEIEYVESPYKNLVTDVKYKGKSIKKGFIISKNSTVQVFVGKGRGNAAQIQVPNLIGKTIIEAHLELSTVSFQLVALYDSETVKTTSDSANAVIQQQSPEYFEGYKAAEGSEITVILK